MSDSSTPIYEAETVIKNEYDFRREILKALDNEFPSLSDAKDTELFHKRLLSALNQEFDQDDIKQTDRFRWKLVKGISELAGGGGIGKEIKVTAKGGDPNGECYLTIYLSNAITDIRGLSINDKHNYGLGAQGKIEMYPPNDHYADVLLLKDSVTMDIVTPVTGYTYTVTGDATPTIQNSYKVFGNCTVTFTAV